MSARSLRAKFILDMEGNLRSQARRFGQSFQRIGRDGERELGRVGRAAAALDRQFNRSIVRAGQIVGAAAGIAAGLTIRRLGTLEERLERLGIEAGKSAAEMDALRDRVNAIASDPKIRIDPSELLGAFEMIQEKTGNLDFGRAVEREMAIAIQATGQAGPVIGDLIASMYHNFGFRTAEEIAAGLDVLTLQGRKGQFTIPNLAAQGPRIFAAFSAFDQGGIEGLAQAGALLQRIRQATGGAEQATTAFEAILRTFLDGEKIKKIETEGRDHGFSAFNEEGRVRDPVALLRDLIRSANGDPVLLSKLFDSEAIRGVTPLAAEFRKTGGFSSLDQLAAIRGDGSTLAGDSARLSQTLNAAGQGLATSINDRLEDNLMGPIKNLTESLNALVDGGVKLTADDALNIALAGVGTLVAAKGMLWAVTGGGGGRPKGGATGGAGGDFPNRVLAVYVTNWPVGSGAGGAGSKNSAKSGNGGFLLAGSGLLGALGAGAFIGDYMKGIFGPISGGFQHHSTNTNEEVLALGQAPQTSGFSHPVAGTRMPLPVMTGPRFGQGDDDLKHRMQQHLEAQQDTADETAEVGKKIDAGFRRMNQTFTRVMTRFPTGTASRPDSGRIMDGPQ